MEGYLKIFLFQLEYCLVASILGFGLGIGSIFSMFFVSSHCPFIVYIFGAIITWLGYIFSAFFC
jgi:hypothetical protein